MSWAAQYEQNGTWHDMHFEQLNVQAQPGGIIQGKGKDEVGEFTFEGSFSPNNPECRIHKQYLGQHAIYYQGKVDPQTGAISGSWGFEPGESNGGFRMRKI